MNIEELSKELYEDLNGRITAVDYADDLIITFQCDDWNNYDVTKELKITCNTVIESEIQPTTSGEVEYTNEHQLLWNHNEPHGQLYYRSEYDKKYELLGRIWEAHEKVFGGWRSLSDYINTYSIGDSSEFCKGRNGLLARGPKPLLDLYQQAIANKIKTNYVSSHNPEGGYKALVFDDCYVICKSVNIEEISS